MFDSKLSINNKVILRITRNSNKINILMHESYRIFKIKIKIKKKIIYSYRYDALYQSIYKTTI